MTEQTKTIVDPKIIVFERIPSDGKMVTAIHAAEGDTYKCYGTMICDIVRHVARAFEVPEEAVWEWVDKERDHQTSNIEEVGQDGFYQERKN